MGQPAPAAPGALAKRYAIGERLLRREKKIAEDLRLIDEDKDALRALSIEAEEGFTIEVANLGTVEVKAGHEEEVTGTKPQLKVATYFGLTNAQQRRLIQVMNVVEIVPVIKRAAKPSVTVRL
jgi:hypothetical protein